MIFKGINILVFLFIIPIMLGLLLIKLFLKKQKDNIILSFVLGIILEFAICEIIAVPMIYLEKSLQELVNLHNIIIGILVIISFIINVKSFKEIIKNSFKFLKQSPKLLFILVIILVGVQALVLAGYMHEDADDATYVAGATVSVQTDTLYKYSAQTGQTTGGEQLAPRYRLGPFPLYIAIIAVSINMHPAIVAHTIFPIIFIPMAYMIYGMLANKLFNGNKKNVFIFLILLSIAHIWGSYSVRTNFTFLLFRIWQGKAILANIIIPLIWLLFVIGEEDKFKFGSCVLIFITILGGILTTTMGIALPPIVLMSLSLAYEIPKIIDKENKFRITNILKCLACCIPAIVYGGIYFML